MDLSQLCEHAVVSRSGFYRWRRQAAYREFREWQDEQDFALIKQTYDYRGYAKGARGIQMRLLHMDPPVIMNIKKIRRLMKKYGLQCPIRKANPYRRMSKDMKTSHVAPNIINRGVKHPKVRSRSLTDITYIP